MQLHISRNAGPSWPGRNAVALALDLALDFDLDSDSAWAWALTGCNASLPDYPSINAACIQIGAFTFAFTCYMGISGGLPYPQDTDTDTDTDRGADTDIDTDTRLHSLARSLKSEAFAFLLAFGRQLAKLHKQNRAAK